MIKPVIEANGFLGLTNQSKKRENETDLEEELKYKKRKKHDIKHKKRKSSVNVEASQAIKEKTSWSNEDFQKLLMNKK